MLKLVKQKALEEKIPIIMDDTLEVLEDLFSNENLNNMLEIGSGIGYSSICFSKYFLHIDTIEKDEGRGKETIQNVKLCNLDNKIKVYIGDAIEILPTIDKKYDVIFIDASKGKYPFFLEQALRMIKNRGYIIADNVLYKGYVLSDYNKHKQRTAVRNLREFLANIEKNKNLEVKILEVGDGLAICKYIGN